MEKIASNPVTSVAVMVFSALIFAGGSCRKGLRVPVGVPGGGVRGRVEGGVVGVVFLWRMRERGKGVGGWGGDRQRNQQVNAHAFVKTTL